MDNTEKKRIKILNYRTNQGIAPKPENIVHGEIAIGYKKDNEAIYIKNSTDEIVDFTPISIVNITYAKLKELRDNSKLKPSQYYRITDFVTTVANDPEAQSAGHEFDLIILATDKNKLQEECYAIQHEGDEYFKNCNLAAWKIWYCLDNDTTKYAWADTANGKGVIYRMIDEWENDCPYDFKNVQFKRFWANGINITKNEGEPKNIILKGYYGTIANADTGIFNEGIDTNDSLFLFTFTRLNNIVDDYEKGSVMQSNVLDESIQTEGFDMDANDDKLGIPSAYHFHNRCRNNILKPTEVGLVVDTKEYMALVLLNNVFITVKEVGGYEAYQPPFDNTLGVSCVNNTFGNNCSSNSFGNSCCNNSFGNECYGNSFTDYSCSNSFGNECSGNKFGNNCYSNSFGNGCYSNTFGNDCGGNTFGYACRNNSFGNYCIYNTFGNNCESNSFGIDCYNNSFGSSCSANKFGYSCRGNKFGNGCNSNTFWEECYNNSFGNDCHDNSFKDICYENSFESSCYKNSFEGSCDNNSFGNECYGNSFTDYSCSNSFGNKCYSNSFSGSCGNKLGDGCVNNSFGNSCDNNSFGNECSENSFESGCYENLFEGSCYRNTFGDNCRHNTFGNNCGNNSFGNNCDHNTFGNGCYSNSFGNNFYSNSFGNGCDNNSFGNDCGDNSFGNYCSFNTFGNYFEYNALGNDIRYIEIPTEKIYHTQILNGTQGTQNNKLTLAFTPEAAYSQFAGFTSDGVLKIWVEADDIVNITYNELKNLRDNSKLKPSQYYRITDFLTKVANDGEARSAEHPFDIIVMASDKDRLQEECYAIQHEGDTYFANCNLAAWKIWYCLDNDTTKYMWADTANGKGVIYRMIDEWQNDCPYDFKNVQFKRYWTNGINTAKPGESKNIILQGYYGTATNGDIFTEGIDTNDSLFCFTFTRLNNISKDYATGSVTQSNVLDESIQTEGFDIDAADDKLNSRCRNNILKPTEVGLVVDTKEYMTLILLNNVFITVKDDKREAYQPPFDNTLGVSCVNNTFGSNTYGLLFLSSCTNNSFGNDCYGNRFGNDCTNNSFGNYCLYNSFGEGCGGNSFGNDCYSNSFGVGCSLNSFGVRCSCNSFGSGCVRNSFGSGCERNSFGNECDFNSFGNYCTNNSFGNYFQYNSFGNNCSNNSFGSGCERNSFGNYFEYNALGNEVHHVKIPTEKIYHTQILNGTKGTQANKLTIAFTPEAAYSQFAGFTSDGVLKIWVEADDIVNITYNELKNLRDNSKLKPSQYYRITDFLTKVANDGEARSAEHPFDIIVMASDKDKLQEECYAIQHEGDTYFANCKLAAWKIWYCLDNDNTKYAWADTTKGKGVIYRMIDEWQNDCPYDFKNVQFKRYAVADASSNGALADLAGRYIGYNSDMAGLSIPEPSDFIWAYTFSIGEQIGEQIGEPGDASIIGYNSVNVGERYGEKGYYGDNTIKPSSSRALIDDVVYSVFCLNNIVWWTNNMLYRGAINGNRIESECSNMTLSGYGTIIEHDCFNFIMGSQCYENSFKTGCSCNTFGNYCNSNSFGNDCNSNSFGNSCDNNSFGNSCYNNSFGNGCYNNTFGNECNSNSFGNTCYKNSFGNSCDNNSFGNYFQYNALGNEVQYVEITTENIYYTHILNGTKGAWDKKLTIAFTPETTYSQFAGTAPDGTLMVWVPTSNTIEPVQGNKQYNDY